MTHSASLVTVWPYHIWPCKWVSDSGAEVDIELTIQAVRDALNGCGDILASADTEEHPNGVEKTNGKVYVANEESDTISVFDSATLSPRTVIPACAGPHHTTRRRPGGTRSGSSWASAVRNLWRKSITRQPSPSRYRCR
jgi:YVTN family beta-propeller protein